MEATSSRRIQVSPDAVVRLARAEEWLKSYPSHSELLIISHSNEAATDAVLRVVESSGACFGVKRFDFNRLASRLAQHALAASNTAPASNLTFTAVVARAIHSLQSEGELSYFERVATRPGFPIAVAKTLEELRMNEVAADSIALLDRGGKISLRLQTSSSRSYHESKLSDRAALFQGSY